MLNIDLIDGVEYSDTALTAHRAVQVQAADHHFGAGAGVDVNRINGGNDRGVDSGRRDDRRRAVDNKRTIAARSEGDDLSVIVRFRERDGECATGIRHSARRRVRAGDRDGAAIVLSNERRSEKNGHEGRESDMTHVGLLFVGP